MKHIDTTLLANRLPNGWTERAREALIELRSAAPEERAAVMRRNGNIWRELKQVLSSLSHDQCWYCETKEIRFDYAVDHFRPKGSVADVEMHAGYWWLAFDYRNFRLSCTYCNSRRTDRAGGGIGGKQDHFPLVDECRRCFQERDDLSRERPLLLDPTNEFDPTLLWFEPDGRAVPRYDVEGSEIFHRRAKNSIYLYNLNEVKVKSRRNELHTHLVKTINRANRQFTAARENCELAQEALETAIGLIRTAINPQSAHSAAARAMLMAFTSQHPWLLPILTTQA